MIISSKICFLTVILTILLLETTVSAKNIAANDCPRVCDREACELPYNCLAGLIKVSLELSVRTINDAFFRITVIVV